MTCEKCGQELAVGQWPFCPHPAVGRQEYHQDEIPGGMLIENGVPEPTLVYSHSDLRKLRDKNGWQVKETWAPYPGTDIDPAGIPNPMGYMDKTTFDNGVALILRGAGAPAATSGPGIDRHPTDADLGVEGVVIHHDATLDHADMQRALKGEKVEGVNG